MRQIQLGDERTHLVFTKHPGNDIVNIDFVDGDERYSTTIEEENLKIALRFMTEEEPSDGTEQSE